MLSYGCIRMFFVNLQDRAELLDFLDSIADYLPADEREQALLLLEKQALAEPLSDKELADQISRHAVLSWPARRAIQQHVESEGGEREWLRVLELARPTTAFLLKRMRERTGAQTLSHLLKAPGIESVLHGEERTEIELLRPEIWAELWNASANDLQLRVEEANRELEQMHQRLQKLERFSDQSENKQELQKKIKAFQDRIYFGGEVVPLQELDEELQLTIGDVLGQS